jgi:hypothetical protein
MILMLQYMPMRLYGRLMMTWQRLPAIRACVHLGWLASKRISSPEHIASTMESGALTLIR